MMSTMAIPFTTRVLVLRFTGPPSPSEEFGCCSGRLSSPSKIIHHPSASLRAGSDTEDTEFGCLRSSLRDLRASVVDFHPSGETADPCDTQDSPATHPTPQANPAK